MLEKVFEGDGMGEEVPGYGGELRLEEHCMSAEGVSGGWPDAFTWSGSAGGALRTLSIYLIIAREGSLRYLLRNRCCRTFVSKSIFFLGGGEGLWHLQEIKKGWWINILCPTTMC